MNREVKFRGFRDRTEQWVYGYLVKREEPYLHNILEPIGNTSSVTYAVRRGSEGQFTGLHDKNGKEIYEGDIIKIINGTVVVDFHYSTLYHIKHHPVEVIGNIYENPELLKGATHADNE